MEGANSIRGSALVSSKSVPPQSSHPIPAHRIHSSSQHPKSGSVSSTDSGKSTSSSHSGETSSGSSPTDTSLSTVSSSSSLDKKANSTGKLSNSLPNHGPVKSLPSNNLGQPTVLTRSSSSVGSGSQNTHRPNSLLHRPKRSAQPTPIPPSLRSSHLLKSESSPFFARSNPDACPRHSSSQSSSSHGHYTRGAGTTPSPPRNEGSTDDKKNTWANLVLNVQMSSRIRGRDQIKISSSSSGSGQSLSEESLVIG
ncbi:hypothetical protein [Phaffia rhodozyma]|uniref:Uncharacterized protein n=1 Tax=Phaffia rhodozyma TaxID=264483 RepID=A0A0F7SWL6_PHARH|nr:hypothetical protein [Phaffia rhodozyma]